MHVSILTCNQKGALGGLVCYNHHRIDRYARSLRDNLGAFKSDGSPDNVPHHIAEPISFCDDPDIRPYSADIHDAYMRFVQGRILELASILRPNDRVTRRHQLVERSHAIFHMGSLQILFHSCSKDSGRHKLRKDIPFSRSWAIGSAIHSSRRELPTSCPSTQATRLGGCDATSGPYLGYHHCQEIYQQKMERYQGRKEVLPTSEQLNASEASPHSRRSSAYPLVITKDCVR
ncbi:hypothetical protein F5141DRAFT_1079283 [Pisolithus sp. B1]|nr:hypothetical protein F5141DRAFT_1079283 [Pisolithus sp. B1]